MLLLVRPVPEALPLHPLKMYWVPDPPEIVPLLIEARVVEPESYQPEPLAIPDCVFTVR
jgi:hypothetical protein